MSRARPGRPPRSGSPDTGTQDGRSAAARDPRAQLSMPLIEAGVGVVLILSLAGLLALGTPAPQAEDPQLDVYAEDVAVVLAEEPSRHAGTTRLAELTRSSARYDREAPAVERRVQSLLPDNLLYRIETPHGAIGFERPSGAVTGTTTVTTQHGGVRIEVWHP